MSPGNTVLVEHGITTEDSDFRVHVCVLAERLYVFGSRETIEAVELGSYYEAPAFTGDIKTATGWLVPPFDIDGVQEIELPEKAWPWISETEDCCTSEKGRRATILVKRALELGLVSLPFIVEGTSVAADIEGADLIITARYKIQVKCDWKGGRRDLGGSGNLYIQRSECNPHGRH